MVSARWHIGLEDLKSAVRHTLVPFAAGVGVAALQAIQVGAVTPRAVGTAAVTAAVAGAIRLLQRWASPA